MGLILADKLGRVDRLAVTMDLEMHVRPSRPAGRAHQRDGLALRHLVTDSYEVDLIVAIARYVAVAMLDLDQVAVTITITRPGYDAIAHSNDFRSMLAGKIDAFMPG